MLAQRITRVFESVTRILNQNKKPRFYSLNERIEWMKGGAVLANIRTLSIPPELAASTTSYGYWRGVHPRRRTEFELALLARGHQVCAVEPRYEVSVVGMSRGRTLERLARRLIALASVVDEKVIEIVMIQVRRRYGMIVAQVVAQPLELQLALRDTAAPRRRAQCNAR